MKQLPGFEDLDHPDYICKLDGALYSLKQASRIFYKLAKKNFIEYGLTMNPHKPCHFFKINPDGTWMDLMIFVDDLNITGMNAELE